MSVCNLEKKRLLIVLRFKFSFCVWSKVHKNSHNLKSANIWCYMLLFLNNSLFFIQLGHFILQLVFHIISNNFFRQNVEFLCLYRTLKISLVTPCTSYLCFSLFQSRQITKFKQKYFSLMISWTERWILTETVL